MSDDICPHCGTNLGDKEGVSRRIGIEVQGVYDGVLFWECPVCCGRWHRWAEGTWQRKRVEALWDAWRES